LLAIEGLGRQLYPDLDLWTTAKPILEDWMRERKDPRAQLKRFVEALPQLGEDLLALPVLLSRAVRDARGVRAGSARDCAKTASEARSYKRSSRERSSFSHAGAALLIAGAIWSGLAAPPWIGWLAAGVGLAMLLAATRAR
jgi:ubiquinone biosynthesis protein